MRHFNTALFRCILSDFSVQVTESFKVLHTLLDRSNAATKLDSWIGKGAEG